MVLAASGVFGGCPLPPDDPPGLEYELRPVAETAADSVDVEFPFQAASGTDGPVFVATHGLTRQVMALDRRGALLGLLGTFGDGPGEYRVPVFLAEKADSVLVFDHDGRASVFGPDGSFVRTAFRNPDLTGAVGNAVLLRGDTLMLSQRIHTLDEFGLPLHVVSPRGDIVRSFGSDDRSVDPAFTSDQWRVMAAASDSSVWAGGPSGYELELWSTGGTLIHRLAPQRSWWVPMARDASPLGPDPPPSRIAGLHLNREAGELMVLIHRARPDWRPPTEEELQTHSSVLTGHLAFIEQVIEVLDPATGLLLGRVVNDTDDYFLRFLGDGRLFALRGRPGGLQVPTVWRVERTGRTP